MGSGISLTSRGTDVNFCLKRTWVPIFFFSNHVPSVTAIHSARDMNVGILSGNVHTDKMLNTFTFEGIVLGKK